MLHRKLLVAVSLLACVLFLSICSMEFDGQGDADSSTAEAGDMLVPKIYRQWWVSEFSYVHNHEPTPPRKFGFKNQNCSLFYPQKQQSHPKKT